MAWGQGANLSMHLVAPAGYARVPSADPDGGATASTSNPQQGCQANVDETMLEYSLSDDEVDDRPNESLGMRILRSMPFQVATALLIVGNSLVIGLETDMPGFEHWDLVENIFLLIFTCELLLRMAIFTPSVYFNFRSTDFAWNTFDFIVVCIGIFDFLGSFLIGGGHNSVAMLFRIVRLLRILRIFRIVRFLKQLYLLAFGLAEAVQALFWVSILMTFILYVCGIVLVRFLGRLPADDPHATFLKERFGGIPKSMFTLFQLMTFPNLDLYEDQGGLLWERPCMTLLLIVFVIFGSFGMIALLTGVISESMAAKNKMRTGEERAEKEQARLRILKRTGQLFDSLKRNELGEAPAEQVLKLMPSIEKMLDSGGVDYCKDDLKRIIVLMDTDSTGNISREEFCNGILALAAGITLQELYLLMRTVNQTVQQVPKVVKVVHGLAASQQELRVASDALGQRVREVEKSGREQVEALQGSVSESLKSLASQVGELAAMQREMAKVQQELLRRSQPAAAPSVPTLQLGSANPSGSPRGEARPRSLSRTPRAPATAATQALAAAEGVAATEALGEAVTDGGACSATCPCGHAGAALAGAAVSCAPGELGAQAQGPTAAQPVPPESPAAVQPPAPPCGAPGLEEQPNGTVPAGGGAACAQQPPQYSCVLAG